ncbi:MAG TPA: molybdenum cofactor guanylyltransferase [Verrucomicrobiae bacterium]|nr:molybdenum cofactor guanylyltransferase [Verrucomicrobiae bacterium]
MNLGAVILAGGKSLRMGQDKAWLEIGGQTLLARQIKLAHECGAEEVFISGRVDKDYSQFACPVLYDRWAEAGPLAGIRRALEETSSSRLLVLAVDMPWLTPVVLRKLAEHRRGEMGMVPRVGSRIEPLAAIYPKLAASLAGALLSRGIHAATTFAENCVRSGLAEFQDWDEGDAGCFASWNRPPDAMPAVVLQLDSKLPGES